MAGILQAQSWVGRALQLTTQGRLNVKSAMRTWVPCKLSTGAIQRPPSQLYSVPFLIIRTIRLVPPHTHAVSYEALDDANLVGPLGGVVRNLDQRVLCLLSICFGYDPLVVIRDILTRSFEQLTVYKWRKRPRRSARRCGLVCGEFKTDEHTASRSGVW
jgi:hypothetical protein